MIVVGNALHMARANLLERSAMRAMAFNKDRRQAEPLGKVLPIYVGKF